LDYTGHSWACKRGFNRAGEACIPVGIPANAELDYTGHSWACKHGFNLTGGTCAAVIVPLNAHLGLGGHDWQCDGGYKVQAQECVAMTDAELQAERAAAAELIRLLAQARRSLQSVDWSSCNDDLDRLRRAARDAADKAEEVRSAKDSLRNCR